MVTSTKVMPVRLARNFLALAGAEFASKLLVFAAFAYLARVAGPVGFGYVEFSVAVLLCAGLIVDLGFGPYGAREIAKAPQRTRELVTEIVLVRLVLAAVAYLIVLGLALWLNRSPILTRLLVVYGLSLFPMCLLLQWVFQGHDQMPTVAATNVVRQVVFVTIVLVLLRTPEQIWYVALAEVAGVCASAVYGLWMYRRRFGLPAAVSSPVQRRGNPERSTSARKMDLKREAQDATAPLPSDVSPINAESGSPHRRPWLSKGLLREGIPIGLSQMFWALRLYGGTLVLGFIVTKSAAGDVGVFGGALRVLIAAHTFVWLYFYNLLPSFSRAWCRGPAILGTIINRSIHGVAWVCALGGFVWVWFAPRVMTLAYGKEFAAGGVVLQWFATIFILAAVSGHFRYALIASGKQTVEMVTSGVGAIVTIVLIPIGYHHFGLPGAAVGLVAAETTASVGGWWFARRLCGLTGQAMHLVRPFLATALVAALLWVLPALSDVTGCVVGISLLSLLACVLDGTLRDQVVGILRNPKRLVKHQPVTESRTRFGS